MLLLGPLFLGCHAAQDAILTPDDDRPVAEITWTSENALQSWVEYRYGTRPTYKSDVEAAPQTEHRFRLAGVPPGTPVEWRLVWDEGNQHTAWESWDVPPQTPPVDPPIVRTQASTDPGYMAVPDVQNRIFWLLDMDGTPVWWQAVGEHESINRVRREQDRLYWSSFYDNEIPMPTFMNSVGLDGAEPTTESLNHHHDFLLLADRMVYLQRVSGTGPDGSAWAGDQVVERDRTSGEERIVWSTFEDVSFELYNPDVSYAEGLDWTHCNGVFFEPNEDAYWVSSKNQQAIFVVTRDGTLLRVLGGPQSTMPLIGEGFGELHAPYLVGNQLYLFNNTRTETHPARAEQYQVDLDNQRYELVDAHENKHLSPEVHGNVTPTQSQGWMISYGVAGNIEVLDASLTPVLRIQTGAQGYVEYLPTLSGPLPLDPG